MSRCFETVAVAGSSWRTALFHLSIGYFAAAFVIAAAPLPARADSGVAGWTLTKIDVVSKLRPEAQVVAESYSAQGGDVEIVTHGEARYNNDPPICPGGYERIHFHWEFPQDVTHIDSGEKRAAVVAASTLEVVKPCWGGFSDNSGIDLLGDNSWPYDVERQQIDVDRVWTDGTNSASSKGDGGTASPGIEFGNWPVKDGQPFAYFYVQLHTYLSQPIDYVYMYRNNADGTDTADGAMPPGTGSPNGVTTTASVQPGLDTTSSASAGPPSPPSDALTAAIDNDPRIEEIADEAPAIVLLVQIQVAQDKVAAIDAPAAVDRAAAAYWSQPAARLWQDLEQAGTDYLNTLSAGVKSTTPDGSASPDELAPTVKLQIAEEQFDADIGHMQAPAQALAHAEQAAALLKGTPYFGHFATQPDLLLKALGRLLERSVPRPPSG